MKKTAVLLALGCAVACQARDICLPNKFMWMASDEFEVGKMGGTGGFAKLEEFYDYDTQMFRFKGFTQVFENGKGVRYFYDDLVRDGKRYYLTGKEGGGSIDCKESAAAGLPYFCLMKGSTEKDHFIVGDGIEVTTYDSETGDKGKRLYSEIALTTDDDTPVFTRSFNETDAVRNQAIYFNFGVNLPSNAFDIPGICKQATQSHNSTLPVPDWRTRVSHLLKPAHA